MNLVNDPKNIVARGVARSNKLRWTVRMGVGGASPPNFPSRGVGSGDTI